MDAEEIDAIVAYVMKENSIPNIQLQKYYQLKWFFSALDNDVFTFQKPSTWHDPFEDFISKLTDNSKDTFVSGLNITNDIYAMSTINKRSECDGMWRNFADTNGVLIYTTSRKIIRSLISYLLANGCCKNKKTFLNNYDVCRQLTGGIKLKKINYMSDASIAKFFKDLTHNSEKNYNDVRFDSLSIKRLEYDYESEYRVFLTPDKLNQKEEVFLSAGYFKETITKIILSPSANYDEAHNLKNKLINNYSIGEDIIEQSKLYDINSFKLEHGFR